MRIATVFPPHGTLVLASPKVGVLCGFGTLLAASIMTLRELTFHPRVLVGRLGLVFARGIAYGAKLLVWVSGANPATQVRATVGHLGRRIRSFAPAAGAVASIPWRYWTRRDPSEGGTETERDRPETKRVEVIFAIKTFDALMRIATYRGGRLPEAVRESIMLTDYLHAEVKSGGRVLIERNGVEKELLIR